jgi:hypothetical protein
MKRAFAGLIICASAWAQAPAETAETIMAKVAENQDRSELERARYLYHQDATIRMIRGNGKLAREERRQYTVMPLPKGTEKKLESFSGKYTDGNKTIDYDKPGFERGGMDVDGGVITGLADDLINDKESRDGVSKDLFPLTRDLQQQYLFKLEGTQKYRGRDVYRVTFRPKPHQESECWAGEALIDRTEFQPVLVTTRLAFGIPFLVKTLLGTNIKQLGFQIAYQRVGDGVWFPVSYGTEFHVRAVFFYSRTITLAVSNTNFQATTVSAEIKIGELTQ